MARTTLHEVILDGDAVDAFSAGDVVRVTEFVVEHPGVEHKLMIGPMHRTPTWRKADYEARLHASLTQGDGEPLRAEEIVFEPVFRSTYWRAAYWPFTPTVAGPYTVTLRLQTPNIPAVHIRVADPLKTDGKRILGY